MAAERSLERCGTDHFDLLLLHNPDRIGYSSEVVWDAMARLRDEGVANAIGVAPGPANGFTLDVIRCVERFGDVIDWAMLILNPLEPWPGRLVLPVCAKHDVKVLARVVDYGGHLLRRSARRRPAAATATTARSAPTAGSTRAGARMERMRPIAERHGLTMLQLACQWNLAQAPVAQRGANADPGAGRRRPDVESKRAELAAVPRGGADAGRGGGDRGDRRQHRLHGAEGRLARPRGRRASRTRGRSTTTCARPPRRWGIDPERDLVLR